MRPDRKARELAETEKVEMRLYEVIYQVLDDVNDALIGMLKPEFEEVVTGEAEVREVFGVPRVGKVAGCYVRSGVITRGSKVRFLREGTIIWKGSIASLRRFKDDVREVRQDFECGIGLDELSRTSSPATSSKPSRIARSLGPRARERRVPSNFVFKAANAIHRPVFQLSKGRLLGRGSGMPVLALTTTGRKSGAKRTSMLTSPLQIDDALVLVASRGGDDRNPDWLFNLQADPAVDIEMGGRSRPMTARIAVGEERADLWSRLTAEHENYAGYQRKTDRDIPVVVLEPR